MIKKRVGILRGGEKENYEISIKASGEVIRHMQENLSDKFKVFDILVDKENIWHLNGLPIRPSELVHKVDVVWNFTHPSLSLILEKFNISSISPGSFSSAVANNRAHLAQYMKDLKIKMPKHIISPKNSQEVLEKFGSPWIIKVGNEIEMVKTFSELTHLINNFRSIIVEEFIAGKPGAVHTLSNFRGADIYVFPPSGFTAAEKEKIEKFAEEIHRYINAEHYLKTDFILHPKRGFFLTNIYFSPDLHPGSHFAKSCEFVGAKPHHVIEHIIENALE